MRLACARTRGGVGGCGSARAGPRRDGPGPGRRRGWSGPRRTSSRGSPLGRLGLLPDRPPDQAEQGDHRDLQDDHHVEERPAHALRMLLGSHARNHAVRLPGAPLIHDARVILYCAAMERPGSVRAWKRHVAGQPRGLDPDRRRRGRDPAGRPPAGRGRRRRALALRRRPVGAALPHARDHDQDDVRLDRRRRRGRARDPMAHKRVHGELPWDAGRFPAGTPYDANDHELQMWVHATLVATSMTVYMHWIGPLTIGGAAALLRGAEGDRRAVRRAARHAARDAGRLLRVLRRHARIRPRWRGRRCCRDVAHSVMRPALPLGGRPLSDASIWRPSGCCRRACATTWDWTGARTASGCSTPRASSCGARCRSCPAPCATSPPRAAPTGAFRTAA